MKAYKMTMKIWNYWKDGNNEGYVKTEKYCLNREPLEKIKAEYDANPYWINFNREKTPCEKRAPKGILTIEEIEMMEE